MILKLFNLGESSFFYNLGFYYWTCLPLTRRIYNKNCFNIILFIYLKYMTNSNKFEFINNCFSNY